MPTVLLISGYGAPGWEWNFSPIRQLLPEEWDVRVLRSGLGHPADRARRISRILDSEDNLYAIGHSMGGVIARLLDLRFGLLDRVVTLGSPLGGVKTALAWPFRIGAAGAMNPMGKLIRRMREPGTAEYLCIAGAKDVIVPRESAFYIEDAEKLEVPGGHLELIRRYDVAELVRDFLIR